MSEWVTKLFGIAVITVFATIILKRTSPDISVILKILCGVILAALCVLRLEPIMEFVREVSAITELSDKSISSVYVLIKVLCVAILTHICATVCRDCGESSIAYYAELGGKIEILILAIPLLREILDMAITLVKMR